MIDEEIELLYEGMNVSNTEYSDYELCLLASAHIYYGLEHPRLIVKVKEGNYQGDDFGLIHDYLDWIEGTNRKRFFYFNYGWSSCSGCDMLEGLGPVETIKSLRNSIFPIPTNTISVTQYIKNEIQNSWNKEAIQEVLEKWEVWRKENRFGEYGNAEWINR